jgi:hypothetical protein
LSHLSIRYGKRLFLMTVVAKTPKKHEMPVGSPYCSDPNCEYCKNLREFSEELRQKESVSPTDKSNSAA